MMIKLLCLRGSTLNFKENQINVTEIQTFLAFTNYDEMEEVIKIDEVEFNQFPYDPGILNMKQEMQKTKQNQVLKSCF